MSIKSVSALQASGDMYSFPQERVSVPSSKTTTYSKLIYIFTPTIFWKDTLIEHPFQAKLMPFQVFSLQQ